MLAGSTEAAQRYAYDYGAGLFAKTYADSAGRRISYRWITGPGGPASNGTWFGMQVSGGWRAARVWCFADVRLP